MKPRSFVLAALVAAGVGFVGWLGCSEPRSNAPVEAPEAAPEPELLRPEPPAEKLPVVRYALPEREARTPAPIGGKRAKELQSTRDRLAAVVNEHGREPTNPWAVSHAMLALGTELELTNERPAVDYLFEEYGTFETVGAEQAPTFPASRGSIRIEPHSDLLLKAFVSGGVTPDRAVTVEGKPTTVGQLYRHSLWRAWIKGTSTGFHGGTYNDAPWALRAIATWAPPELTWKAQGGRDMSLADMTHRLAEVLAKETSELKVAQETGEAVKKDTRRGIFRYTCGGQHLVQGVAYAVGRGFHRPGDQDEVCAQLDLLRWRIDVELGTLDPLIEQSARPIQVVLLGQRLKFLGHYLETVHKIGALGLCDLDKQQVAASQRVADELIATVRRLDELEVWDNLASIQTDNTLDRYRQGGAEQVYLDFVGDASHAVRGIDLALGRATVRY